MKKNIKPYYFAKGPGIPSFRGTNYKSPRLWRTSFLSLFVATLLGTSSPTLCMQNLDKQKIFKVIENNDIDGINEIFKDDTFDINQTNEEGQTLLFFSILKIVAVSTIKELLKNEKIDVNKVCPFELAKDKSKSLITPLYLACLKNDREIIHALLKNKKTDINIVPSEKFNYLNRALEFGYLETFKLLLLKGAKPKLSNKFNYHINNQFKTDFKKYLEIANECEKIKQDPEHYNFAKELLIIQKPIEIDTSFFKKKLSEQRKKLNTQN